MLVTTAATRWGVPAAECVAELHQVSHIGAGKSADYAAAQSTRSQPGERGSERPGHNRAQADTRSRDDGNAARRREARNDGADCPADDSAGGRPFSGF